MPEEFKTRIDKDSSIAVGMLNKKPYITFSYYNGGVVVQREMKPSQLLKLIENLQKVRQLQYTKS